MDGAGPSNPFPFAAGFSNSDDDDSFLQNLQFFYSDGTEPLALPDPPSDRATIEASDAMQDPSEFLDFNEHLLVEGPTDVNQEDGNLAVPALNGQEDENVGAPPLDGQQIDCNGCFLLREVVHTNGLQSMKLAIHGGLGVFYHAWVEVEYYNADGLPPAIERSYVDFSTQTYEFVKQFLADYGLLRLRDSFFVTTDSLSTFYDALCVRMIYEVAETSNPAPSLPEPSGLPQSGPTTDDNRPIRMPKTGIAAQRERTGKLHLRDLADYFHLPIAEAAKVLNICSTALKTICRKHGVARWPYRKIKSIDKLIAKLERFIDTATSNGTSEGVASAQADIEKLREQRARLCAGLPPLEN